jgi:hypothetical protein
MGHSNISSTNLSRPCPVSAQELPVPTRVPLIADKISLDATSRVHGVAQEAIPKFPPPHIKRWTTNGRDMASPECYTRGPTAIMEVADGERSVMAVLVSFELGQWMMKCVQLQRQHGELEATTKEELLDIDAKLSASSPWKEQRQKKASASANQAAKSKYGSSSAAIVEETYQEASLDEATLKGLLARKQQLQGELKEVEEEWFKYMESVSISHDDAFIAAGIIEDYEGSDAAATSQEGDHTW